MQFISYLTFNGNCREAFTFYQKCLGGSIVAMMSHGEAPSEENIPSEWHDRIMHARLIVDGAVLMGSDAPPERYREAQRFSVSLVADTVEDAERIYNLLSESGNVEMPLHETFWAHRFAMFTDKFGIPWMINCEKPMG